MLEPYAYFVVEHMSRASIADRLNRYLGRQEFRPNDERLTDRFCRLYASSYGRKKDTGENCNGMAIKELGLEV